LASVSAAHGGGGSMVAELAPIGLSMLGLTDGGEVEGRGFADGRAGAADRDPGHRGQLEPEIDGRQADLGAAEDGRRFLEIVAGMRADRMDVAPGPLDRICEIYRAGAAGPDC